jgi:hypothetical protein
VKRFTDAQCSKLEEEERKRDVEDRILPINIFSGLNELLKLKSILYEEYLDVDGRIILKWILAR